MNAHSDRIRAWAEMRRRIIGLSGRSIRKTYYPELQKRLAELERLNQVKSEFLNIASHELRTPLTSLRLLIVLLRKLHAEGEFNQAVAGEHLQRMEKLMSRLSIIVKQLLDASRLEQGVLKIHPTSGNLLELTQATVEEFKLRYPEREFKISGNLSAPVIPLDMVRVTQVLESLLDNAARFSPREASIEIQLGELPGSLQVRVVDRGPGISSEEQKGLFTQFYRTSASRARALPGLGLSLYISRQIVEAHGGTLSVQTGSAGSTFCVSLPRFAA